MKEMILTFLIVLGFVANVYAHEHHAPHNGILIVLGEEFAHLELVLDKETGTLSAYSLDGEAENSAPLNQQEIVFKIMLRNTTSAFDLTLKAVANPLTGETVGNTSEFKAQADALKGLSEFKGMIVDVVTKGQDFKDVSFDFPEGNDHDDDKK